MPDSPKAPVQSHPPPPSKRLTPTDMAQFLRLGECRRYLKLRQHERRKGSDFLHKYGVAPQSIPPLLTLSGQQFEQRVEKAARASFKVIHCGDNAEDAEDIPRREAAQAFGDNQLVVGCARTLPCGETLLIFQPRLEAVLGDWHFTGDLDILRLSRSAEGKLSALIVDMKSTTKVKLEHRLQVAFYHDMLAQVLGNANVAVSCIDLGIVYRGSVHAEDALTGDEAAQHTAAQKWLGAGDALLEIIAAPEDYLCEVREMVIGPDAVVNQIAAKKVIDTFFHLSYKCDGCLYQQWCMKAAFEDDDLSLIPTLTASEKRTLLAAGITATAEVATLMRIATKPGGRPELVPAQGREDLVRRLRASSVGPRLSEIIHRAKSARSARCREIATAKNGRVEASAEAKERTKGRKEVVA